MKSRIHFVLSVLGIAVSTYLLASYQSEGAVGCTDSGCQQVRDSAYSHLFGQPVPLFGVLFYGVMALLQVARPWLARNTRPLDRLALGLSLAGVLFSAWLTYLEAFVIHAFCPWCVVSAALAVGLAVVCVLQVRRPEVVDPEEPPLWSLRGHVAWGAAALLLFAAVSVAIDARSAQRAAEQQQAEAERVYPKELLERPDSQAMGPKDAPVQIVVFSDARCNRCADTIPLVVDMVRSSSRYRLVFRHFPLKMRSHRYAKPGARAEEAAAEQGKFWPMSATLMTRQDERWDPPVLEGYARGLKLDLPKFRAAMASDRLAKKVERDRSDGDKLGVTSTPSFFVNGRMVPMPRMQPEEVIRALQRKAEELVPSGKGGAPPAAKSK
ncbi:MAG TPA: vitamin K epoxide reductase family protein [Armatimonadota bacterium]|jgi:protein-disulfide isomerase